VIEPAGAAPPGLARLRALIEGYVSYLEREVFPGAFQLHGDRRVFERARTAITARLT
jgi:hypothetical protein